MAIMIVLCRITMCIELERSRGMSEQGNVGFRWPKETIRGKYRSSGSQPAETDGCPHPFWARRAVRSSGGERSPKGETLAYNEAAAQGVCEVGNGCSGVMAR